MNIGLKHIDTVYRATLCSNLGLFAHHFTTLGGSHCQPCMSPFYDKPLHSEWSPMERSSHFPLLDLFGSALPYSRWLENILPVCL